MRSSVRSAMAGSIALVAVLALAGCGGSDASGSSGDGPYIIMVSGADDGAGQALDLINVSQWSTEAGVNVVNAEGGINGRQIELIVSPDNGDPTKAITALQKQIAKDKPDAYIVSGGVAAVTTAILPALDQAGIISFGGSYHETGDPENYPLSFNMAPTSEIPVEGFVPTLEEEGYEKVALLYGNDGYTGDVGAAAKKIFVEAGFDLVSEQYDANALDMGPQLEALRAEDPDVLVVTAIGAPVGYIMRGIEKIGWDIPVLADTAVTATPLISTGPPDGLLGSEVLDNVRIQVYKSTVFDPDNAVTVKMVNALAEVGDVKGSLLNAWNYDAVIMLAEAAERAGSEDSEAIAAEMVKPDFGAETAIIPSYGYTEDSHESQPDLAEYTFIPPSEVVNGQFGHPGD